MSSETTWGGSRASAHNGFLCSTRANSVRQPRHERSHWLRGVTVVQSHERWTSPLHNMVKNDPLTLMGSNSPTDVTNPGTSSLCVGRWASSRSLRVGILRARMSRWVTARSSSTSVGPPNRALFSFGGETLWPVGGVHRSLQRIVQARELRSWSDGSRRSCP